MVISLLLSGFDWWIIKSERKRGHRLCTFGILHSFPTLKQMERNWEKNLSQVIPHFLVV